MSITCERHGIQNAHETSLTSDGMPVGDNLLLGRPVCTPCAYTKTAKSVKDPPGLLTKLRLTPYLLLYIVRFLFYAKVHKTKSCYHPMWNFFAELILHAVTR